MKPNSLDENPEQTTLQALAEDLFLSTSATEISSELELMLSVYIQYAPVNRLDLANAAGLTSKLMVYMLRAQAALEQGDLTTGIEHYTD